MTQNTNDSDSMDFLVEVAETSSKVFHDKYMANDKVNPIMSEDEFRLTYGLVIVDELNKVEDLSGKLANCIMELSANKRYKEYVKVLTLSNKIYSGEQPTPEDINMMLNVILGTLKPQI